MKATSLFFIFSTFLFLCSCKKDEQPPEITYPDTCEANYFKHAYLHLPDVFRYDLHYPFSIVSANDSGFFMFHVDTFDIAKYSKSGTFQWGKNFAEGPTDFISGLGKTPDGNLIFLYTGKHTKIDTLGNILWQIQAVSDNYYGSSSLLTNDNGFIFSYQETEDPSTNLVGKKFNASGALEWTFEYPSQVKSMISIFQTSDNGYIMAGTSKPEIDTYVSHLIKLDAGGDFQWEIIPVIQENAWIKDVVQNSDGITYTITTTENELIKVDSSGSIIWQTTFPGYARGTQLMILPNNEYIIAGEENEYIMLAKFNSNGALLWKRSFGGEGVEDFKDMTITNNGFAIVGTTTNYIGNVYGLADFNYVARTYLVTTDMEGNTCY